MVEAGESLYSLNESWSSQESKGIIYNTMQNVFSALRSINDCVIQTVLSELCFTTESKQQTRKIKDVISLTLSAQYLEQQQKHWIDASQNIIFPLLWNQKTLLYNPHAQLPASME